MASQTLLSQWREANRAAFDAEHSLFEATLQYLSGRGEKPSEDEMARAKRLRGDASELFKVAMAQFSTTAPSFNTKPVSAGAGTSRKSLGPAWHVGKPG
jgi:hypothetical protein